MYITMVEIKEPLLVYSCSISVQEYDSDNKPKTFSIFGGDRFGFSSNVLKHMRPSKEVGSYRMVFDPEKKTLTISVPK